MAQAQKDIAKSITSALDLEQQLQISYAQKGVCVLDVYSAEWGQCKAISETFRRLNNDAGDAIHLRFFTVECNAVLDSLKSEDPAAARHHRPKNVDAIRETLPEFWQPLLEARRGKSKPYFLLYKDGKKAYEVDGVNTPQIRAFVKDLCTVKTPAHEFITNAKALEFWEAHFNAEESEVGVEKFMRALTAVCALQVALTDDERVALYEALGTSKDAREKIITAEALQRWVGEDEGRGVAQAFHDTLPEYEARAKQVRATRDAEEKKRVKEEADAKATHDKKDAEERAAAERVQEATDNMEAAVAAEEARNPIPTREELDAMTAADAVARLDDGVEALLPDAHIHSAKEGDVSRKLSRGMRSAMEAAWSAATSALRPVSLLPSTVAAEPVLFDLIKSLKKSHSLLKELGAFVPTPTLTVAVQKARENPIARGCGAHLAALAVTLVTSTAEQNAASIGAAQTAEVIADLDFAAVLDGKPLSKPNILSMLLFAVADNDEVTGPFFALVNAADLPEEGDMKKDVVLPLLAPMSTVPVEAPEGTVLVKIVGIDRVVRVSETVVMSAGMHVGSIGALDGGRPTFAADMPLGADLLPELAAKFLTRLKEDERRLIALDKIAKLRELRRDYAKRVPDPFWEAFDAKFPLAPSSATRAVFESIDTTKNGTLGVNEVIKAMRHTLSIPAGDDIAPVVKSSFEAVKAAPMKGVKKAERADAISFGEFVGLVRYLRSYFGIWRIFASFQNKSSQQMTKADVVAAAPALARLSPAVDMSDEIFDELDTDKSGVVTFTEFARWALNKNLDIMMNPEKDILNTSERIDDDDEDEAPSSPAQEAGSHAAASAPAAAETAAASASAAAAAPAHHDDHPKAPTPAPVASAADAAVAKSASNAGAAEPPAAAKTPTPPPSSSHAAVAEAPIEKAPTPEPVNEVPAKAPTPVQEPEVKPPTPVEEPAKAPTPTQEL